MVLSVIFGEEPEEAPPPPPPPPPTRTEKFKAAVQKQVTNVKESYEYQKKKRETKKRFKGIGDSSVSSSSADASDYRHDKFEVLPTRDQAPQVESQGYQPHDIDYWNAMSHYTNKYNQTDNRTTYSKKTATFKSAGKGSTTQNIAPQTINNRPETIRYETLRNETLRQDTLRQETRQYNPPSRGPSDWEYLDSKPGNLQNRTLRKSGGTFARTDQRRRYYEEPDTDGALYDDRISLQTNKIHHAARTNDEQLRVLEQEERERRRNAARRRRTTLAEDVISGAAKCSRAIVGLFNRTKISVLYMCGVCHNSAWNFLSVQ